MNLMDIMRGIVYLLVFTAIVTTAVFFALNHFEVVGMAEVWVFSPLWIAGIAVVGILSFVGVVAMFHRRG